MDAYDEGCLAFKHGILESENPFAIQNAEWDSWRAGWIMAHDMDSFTLTVEDSYIA